MDNNKRDYNEFFEGGRDDSIGKDDRRERQHDQEHGESYNESRDSGSHSQEKSSYYYSYGPFKSSSMKEETPSASRDDGEATPVEITSPRPLRPYYGYGEQGQQNRQPTSPSQWDYNPAKKRFPLKSYFITFLAGAVVVSGLMFTSDRMNLFSNDNSPAMTSNSGGGAKSAVNSNGGNGGASTAALNEIVRPGNISDIVNNTSGAVVKINTYVSAGSNKSQRNGVSSDDIFNYFFGNGGNGGNGGNSSKTPTDSTKRQANGLGSGFIFDKSGYILTNQHVVDGASEIEVEVQGYSKPFKAKLMGSEYNLDLAVLKIEDSKDFPFLPMGSSDDIKVGEWVVAIGNPYGFDHTVTVGVVSAKERPIDIPDNQGTRKYEHLLQTDASINPGNSGGPLLNLNGEVIGINTAVSAQAQGIGFAIPTSTVTAVLDNLKTGVKMPQPYIGVGLNDIQDEWVKQLNLENNKGSVITQVESGSPASKAGLTAGDVIIEVNGTAVSNSTEVTTKIKALKADDKVTLKIVRDGKKMETFVIVGDRNKS